MAHKVPVVRTKLPSQDFGEDATVLQVLHHAVVAEEIALLGSVILITLIDCEEDLRQSDRDLRFRG